MALVGMATMQVCALAFEVPMVLLLSHIMELKSDKESIQKWLKPWLMRYVEGCNNNSCKIVSRRCLLAGY